MGAAESLFFEEEEEEEEDEQQQQPSIAQQQYPTTHYPSTAPANTGGIPRKNIPENGPSRVARRQKRRSLAGDPPKLVHGLILGLPSSGKRTLLERLKGKDPFANTDQDLNGSQPIDDDSVYQAIVPYQAPSGSSMWDRLQIGVEVAPHEVPFSSNRIDFAVVMVNPKHDRNHVQAKLNQVISDLLKQYEYTQQQQQRISEKDTQQSESSFGVRAKNALCLCFLVNFRDLQNSKKRGLQQTDIKQCVLGLLQQHADKLPPREQLLLQFGTTSLYNCYGLSTLHHFIYQTYLRLKQNELEQQLQEVREETTKSQNAPHTKYKNFLKMLEETEGQNRTRAGPAKQSKPREELTSPQSLSSHQLDEGDGVPNKNWNIPGQEQHAVPEYDSKQRRRQIMNEGNSLPLPIEEANDLEPQTQKSSRDALEAFLASDDEEEDVRINTNPKKKGNSQLVSDDDDDDDDFFYDESGNRRRVNQAMQAEDRKTGLSTQTMGTQKKDELLISSPARTRIAQSPSVNSKPEAQQSEATNANKDELHSPNGPGSSVSTKPSTEYSSNNGTATQSNTAEQAEAEHRDVAISDDNSRNDDTADNDSATHPLPRSASSANSSIDADAEDPGKNSEGCSGQEKQENDPEAADNKTRDPEGGSIEKHGSSQMEMSDSQSQDYPQHSQESANRDEKDDGRKNEYMAQKSHDTEGEAQSHDERAQNSGSVGAEAPTSHASIISSSSANHAENESEPPADSESSSGQNDGEVSSDTKNGKGAKAETSKATPNTSTDEKPASSANDDSEDDGFFVNKAEDMGLAKSPHGVAGDDDSDDDEFFIDESAATSALASNRATSAADSNTSPEGSPSKTLSDDNESDNAETSSSPSKSTQEVSEQQTEPQAQTRPQYRKNRHMQATEPQPAAAKKAEASPGLSAAAQAAIEAAQRDFEQMMHEGQETEAALSLDEKAIKRAKKKDKKKESKKEKREKKEKKKSKVKERVDG